MNPIMDKFVEDPTSGPIGGHKGATYPYERMAEMAVQHLAGEHAQRISMERDPERTTAKLDQLVGTFLRSADISEAHAAFVAAVAETIDMEPESRFAPADRMPAIMAAFDAAFRSGLPARGGVGQRDPLGLRSR